MRSPVRRSFGRMTGVVATALAVGLVGGGIASAAPAETAPPTTINVNFKVDGTTYLKKVDASMALGTGELATHLNPKTGAITADLTLPPGTLSYKQFGILPVTSTVELTPASQTTGQLTNGAVTAHAEVVLKLTSLKVAGLPIPIGDNCASAEPVGIDLVSGPGFQILKGGDLLATYDVGDFANCGLATFLINGLIVGKDNTIKLNLHDPHRP